MKENLNPVILYRPGYDIKEEFDIASNYFKCIEQRTNVLPNDLVIGRYSVLPFYKELEIDINNVGGKLINSFHQHMFVSDLGNWTDCLHEFTPKTWAHLDQIPDNEGPFVVKGQTNSKKFLWNKLMFAEDKQQASNIMWQLSQDGLLCDQHIYFRKYVPLVRFYTGFNGLPITKEFRFFVCNKKILSGGYYWTGYELEETYNCDPNQVPKQFLQKVIDKVDNKINFYSIDVAQAQSGEWIVIELNDGQMSGLSSNDPNTLYKNLYESI